MLTLLNCSQTVGWSAVFFAAKSGHLEIVKSLIDAGALVDIRDKVRSLVSG